MTGGMTGSSSVLDGLWPTERLLFESDIACAGTFDCAVAEPSFAGGFPSTAHCVVFSRTPVWIQHDGGVRYAADPTRVTFHNRGRAYRRWKIDARGDHCEWLAYPAEVVTDVVGRLDPRHVDRQPAAPFRFQFAPAGAALYLRQRLLFARLHSARREPLEPLDPLGIEEAALVLLGDAVAPAYAAAGVAPRGPRVREFAAVQHVRASVAREPGRSTSLRGLASTVGMSPFQLCRAFVRVSGETLSAYRTRLRLLSSLERVRAGDDLTDVAMAFGFSSHSHFTAAFRRAFGTVPSRVREPLGKGLVLRFMKPPLRVAGEGA
jgi:AraC-like DNA-binding protein